MDWSYLYNVLHDYYSSLELEKHITEIEMEDCLDIIHEATLGELQERCVRLDLVSIPTINFME